MKSKKQPTKLEKILGNHVSDMELAPQIYAHCHSTVKGQVTHFFKWAKDLNRYFTGDIKVNHRDMRDAQHH